MSERSHTAAMITCCRGAQRARRPRKMARGLSWDTADALYFIGYTLWNYVSTTVHARPGFDLREDEPRREGGESWRRRHASDPVPRPSP
jgi:hypothetical protein